MEKIIKEKINIPVFTKNDAMCAGIAEKEYGSLRGCNNGVFLGFGTGVGTAVFLHGRLEEDIRSARTHDYTKKWEKVQLWKTRML